MTPKKTEVPAEWELSKILLEIREFFRIWPERHDRQDRRLREIEETQREILKRLERIEHCACKRVVSYRIRQTGGSMQPIEGAGSHFPRPEEVKPSVSAAPVEAKFKEKEAMAETQTPVIGILVGATGSFEADPIDQNGDVITDPAILSTLTLTWASADTTNEPVVSSGTTGDLGATITVPASAVDGPGALLTVTDQNGISGSVDVPVLPAITPPVTTVSGYVIRQTA